ncbi:hypothetical protein N9381_07610 [Paracoccaceae bacterium]|nr:hypothetical protein [Paracoccaceae bacterium]
MSKDKDEDFSLIDLDHDIVKSAVIKTIDRELTNEEIEDLALSQMETDEGFILEEKRMAQGLSNFPFEGSDVFVPLDEDGNEITHNLKDLLRIASGWYVRKEFGYYDIPSSEILILIDDKEDTISSAAPRILAASDRSKEETTPEKTEPRKLGEVRFEDMF